MFLCFFHMHPTRVTIWEKCIQDSRVSNQIRGLQLSLWPWRLTRAWLPPVSCPHWHKLPVPLSIVEGPVWTPAQSGVGGRALWVQFLHLESWRRAGFQRLLGFGSWDKPLAQPHIEVMWNLLNSDRLAAIYSAHSTLWFRQTRSNLTQKITIKHGSPHCIFLLKIFILACSVWFCM